MNEKHICLNTTEEELAFAKKKIEEYPSHIPSYKYEDSYLHILRLLYNKPDLPLSDLSELHDETLCHHYSKIQEPEFADPSVFIKDGQCYTQTQTPRLHLLSILLGGATTHVSIPLPGTNAPMPLLPHLNYCFFAKKLIEADLKDISINYKLRKVLTSLLNFFEEETSFLGKHDQNSFIPKTQCYPLLTEQLNEIKSLISDIYNTSSNYTLPPFWNNIGPTSATDKETIIPPKPQLARFYDAYTYYVIIWNYIFLLNRTDNMSDLSWITYQSSVQNCYDLYLLELCHEHYGLSDLVRTIRYHFAYKVFRNSIDLIKAHHTNNQVLLLSPYLNTFLKTNYTRPESTINKKGYGKHSTVSEYYDTTILAEKIKVMIYGDFSCNNGDIVRIALPIKNNNPDIGGRNLAYVLGIPESKDFFDKILHDKPTKPQNKIPTKISALWSYSINILSYTYDNGTDMFDDNTANNLGFLLHGYELEDFATCLVAMIKKRGGIAKLTKDIESVAKKEKNYITAFDIKYFKLFHEHLREKDISKYLWFTLPFIHIANALAEIEAQYNIRKNIPENDINNYMMRNIYSSLGQRFILSNIQYSTTDINQIKADAIVDAHNDTIDDCQVKIQKDNTGYHKYIIQAKSPAYSDNKGQENLLNLYYTSLLNHAMQNNCHSIVFPISSSDYPFHISSPIIINALKQWQYKHFGYHMDITLCFQSQAEKSLWEKVIRKFFVKNSNGKQNTLLKQWERKKRKE